ncbi:hypothetical protein ABPG75_013753 [Micractinium tetrahymenae]
MEASRQGSQRLLLLAVLAVALLAGTAAGATKKRSRSNWACGPRSKGELCKDKKTCCAKWGTCGKTEKYCGAACISGECWPKSRWSRPSPKPSPKPAPAPRPSPKPVPAPRPSPSPSPSPSPKPSPSPSPKPKSPPPPAARPLAPPPAGTKPTAVHSPPPASDTYFFRIADEGMGMASCSEEGAAISAIISPIYGNRNQGCNATNSFFFVAAACIGQPACVVRASKDVYGNPCPKGVKRWLEFSYRCSQGSPILPESSPTPSPAASPSPSPVPRPSPSPSPPPPRPSPPPPSPKPSPPPPSSGGGTSGASSGTASKMWGKKGESWSPAGPISDWSYAGYAAGDQPIPSYTDRVINVASWGAVADGNTDSSTAFQKAIDAASKQAAPGAGVTVEVPPGRFVLKKDISITSSNVVLKGAGAGQTTLYFPNTLSQLKGPGKGWAFSGGIISIVGKRVDSSRSQNYLASVTADAARGDTRLRVSSTNPFRVGQWVRIWVRTPGNQKLSGRRLLTEDTPAAAPSPAMPDGTSAAPATLPLRLFEDPYVEAAVAAAAAAENAAAAAAAAAGPEGPDPGTVLGQSADPAVQAAAEEAQDAALNPLNLEPMVRAAARHAFDAIASEIADGDFPADLLAELTGRTNASSLPGNSSGWEDPEKVPALAVSGSLDYYLYGDNPNVDSGENYNVFPTSDHIRMASRVAAIGNGWIELERPLPWDLREKWSPVLHTFAPSVQNSGLEGFTVEFPWGPFPEHFWAGGANAIAIYDVANCWVRDVGVVNADNGIILSSVDFITIERMRFSDTKQRASGALAKIKVPPNGHHALWTSRSSDVLFNDFFMERPWVHDVSLDQFAELTVYANGGSADLNFDCHRAGTHSNLFTNIDLGAGTRAFHSGGAGYRGAHSGANNTWWNVYASKKGMSKAVDLLACSFGPQLNFFGNWGKPAASDDSDGGSRRRLAQAAAAGSATSASADEAPILALALGADGPIIIPEEVDPQNPELVTQALGLGLSSASHASTDDGTAVALSGSAAAPAPAPAAAAGPAGAQQVGALGSGDDCSSMRWRVERAAYDKRAPLQPADLWSAQVARRRAAQK